MKIVVTPSKQVFESENKEKNISLLKDNLVKKLGNNGISVSAELSDGEIVFGVGEEKVSRAVHYLEYLPGVGSVSPCMFSEGSVDSLMKELEENDIEPRKFQASTIPKNLELEEEISERLEDEGWTKISNPDIEITVRKFEEEDQNHFLISMHTSKGTGGLPVDVSKPVIVPLRNRLDLYASLLALKQGFSVHPLTIKNNTDDLEEGITVLKEYSPATKPLVLESDNWLEGVEKAVEIVKPVKIVIGRVEGEEPLFDFESLEIPVEEPLKDISEEEVLQMYQSIRPVIL